MSRAATQPERPWAAWGAGIAAAAAVVFFVLLQRDRSEELATTPAVAQAAELPTPQQVDPPVAIDDFTPEVGDDSSEPNEDTMVLEEGSLAIGSGRERRVAAGPYAVVLEDDGACVVAWDPQTQTLDVDVREGVVVLHGPTFVRTIVAGDKVQGTPAGVTVTTRAATVAPETPDGDDALPRWRELAAQGRYRDAMDEVERRGVLGKVQRLGRSDLKVLADVTRLGGAPDQSVGVLTTLRSRFPKSREAKRAAFHLGRHAEREGRDDDAMRWYRAYLEASPHGSLVQQVRGRLFTLLATNGRRIEARAIAADYLERDPEGPYAAAAARLADE